MSSETSERPVSGTIEVVGFSDVPGVEVTTYLSDLDGASVIEIDTQVGVGQVRVYVNEGAVFDQDPEEPGPHGECGFVFRVAGKSHRCVTVGLHQPGHRHRCGCGEEADAF